MTFCVWLLPQQHDILTIPSDILTALHFYSGEGGINLSTETTSSMGGKKKKKGIPLGGSREAGNAISAGHWPGHCMRHPWNFQEGPETTMKGGGGQWSEGATKGPIWPNREKPSRFRTQKQIIQLYINTQITIYIQGLTVIKSLKFTLKNQTNGMTETVMRVRQNMNLESISVES